MTTSPQLADLRRELDDAERHAHDIARRAGAERWAVQPPDGGWSVGHCIEHLTITSDSFLPRLEEAVAKARESDLRATGAYHVGVVGWLFCRMLEPPYRMRVKTPPPFDPSTVGAAADVVSRFDARQERLNTLIVSGEGLALDRILVVSPFSTRVKYSVYASLRIISAHQRRHLWQAERVLDALDRPLSSQK